MIERIYRRLDALRSLAVLAFASDETLDAFNAVAYGSAERYDPGSPAYVSSLYPWEEVAIDRHFPPPPARILVGGAGAGREPIALAERGYVVVAFEPVPRLATAMANAVAAAGVAVTTLRGSYRHLPQLESQTSTQADPLLPDFDAAVMGWGSFSHLYTESDRIDALESISALTGGPILVSFTATRSDGPVQASRLRAWLLKSRGRHPADRFSISLGFQHPVSEQEIRDLAAAADLNVVAVEFSHTALAPHAVLERKTYLG